MRWRTSFPSIHFLSDAVRRPDSNSTVAHPDLNLRIRSFLDSPMIFLIGTEMLRVCAVHAARSGACPSSSNIRRNTVSISSWSWCLLLHLELKQKSSVSGTARWRVMRMSNDSHHLFAFVGGRTRAHSKSQRITDNRFIDIPDLVHPLSKLEALIFWVLSLLWSCIGLKSIFGHPELNPWSVTLWQVVDYLWAHNYGRLSIFRIRSICRWWA